LLFGSIIYNHDLLVLLTIFLHINCTTLVII
jgi:hypothetical protein